MDMLQGIRAFAQVASAGSFTAAAQQLAIGTPQVSRAIADLETHLNTRLLNRTTRQVALTEAGERYLFHCEAILTRLAEAEAEALGLNSEPSGTLKIGVTASFDRHHLPHLISSYQERYPQVSVSVTLAQQVTEIPLSHYDVLLLCSSNPPEPRMASECLGATSSILCASSDYLARYGVPQTLTDLKQHRCVRLADDLSSNQWMFDGPNGHEAFSAGRTVLQCNLSDMLNDSVQAGLGIGPLPVSVGMPGLRTGSLVRVLPEYRMKARNAYVLYSSARHLDAKIRTWVEFLKEALPQRLANDQAAFSWLVTTFRDDGTMPGNVTQNQAL
ncbi:LysR family transcriptional regulator [Paraburkholderia sediminicola]|uniref:LysR family transcriptional regulator n=1 Tax=Paraburkholderia sediminicola TaxID=458836 RepID=UPI0038BD4AD3